MKIVHVIARLNVGGAALSVLELAAGQQRRGHDVLVVAGTIPDGEASMEHVADELGVPSLHLGALQREVSFRNDTAATAALRRLIRARRPDVLHTHTSKAGTTGRVAAALSGSARPAVVHTYHGHVLSGYFSARRERFYRIVERSLAPVADALVAVSDEVRDELVSFGVARRDKFTVIPYGFDLDRRIDTSASTRAAKRREIGVDGNAFVLGWAGRMTAIKRPEDLVQVLALVDDAVLVMAGDGELRGDVEALAQRLGVADRIRALGYVEDMGAWYAAFDVFLLVSANEGAPVVAIEALAGGLPVVATAAGGTGTVVDDDETGFLVPIGDVAALADRIRRLRDDAGLRERFGAEGARRMRQRFSTERMVDDVDRLYARVAGS